MIVLIDNNDSFSYNLAHYLGGLGAEVQLFRHNQLSLEQLVELAPKAIIISSGFGIPAESGLCLDVVHYFAGKIPILGISLGHQIIAQAFGGRINPAPQPMHGKAVPIYHNGQAMYEQIPSPFLGARYHSFIVERETLPECLEVSSWTEEGLIMGLRHKEWAIEGVQFQPESILTPQGLNLVKNFLRIYSLVNS